MSVVINGTENVSLRRFHFAKDESHKYGWNGAEKKKCKIPDLESGDHS